MDLSQALFEYVVVHEDECGGAAVDLVLEPGIPLKGIRRCCKHCTLLECEIYSNDFGRVTHLFAPAELKPLNDKARALLLTCTVAPSMSVQS